jgi:hypothetical protein
MLRGQPIQYKDFKKGGEITKKGFFVRRSCKSSTTGGQLVIILNDVGKLESIYRSAIQGEI